MTQYGVSVIMPVKNGIPFVKTAVESIIGQSLKDFEFIIVDDGSTDGTSELLEKYREDDDRLQIVHNHGAPGLVGALNYGIACANGDFVARMDADDIAFPERLELQRDYLLANPNVGMVAAKANLINEFGELIENSPNENEGVQMISLQDLVSGYNPIVHPSVMFTRELFIKCEGYRSVFETCEDLDLWIRFAREADISILNEPLLLYRIHKGSVSRQKAWKQLLLTQLLATYSDEELLSKAEAIQALDESSARKLMTNKTVLRIVAIAADSGDTDLFRDYWREYEHRKPYIRLLTGIVPLRLLFAMVRERATIKRIMR